ncbi:flagellar hook-basal body complex protein [Bacillus sp. T3]|uniref:flagellar hook-basal body complex protein n=1 Tax=Bacillus sp. T3 TaxID=467262 RepID=UPI0039923D70
MIDGDAYFIVGPEKELNGNIEPEGNLLTKAGNFTLDGNGFLVSSNGFFVSGTTGEPGVGGATGTLKQVAIKITEDEVDPSNPKLKFTSYSIDSNGFINVVREDGKIGVLAIDASGKYKLSEDPQSTENISLTTATVSNPSGLSKVGNTMFQVTGNSGAANTGRISDIKGGSINAGALEMSNVDLTEEFTEMIVAQRGFQANSRIITTSDSILEELVNLKR